MFVEFDMLGKRRCMVKMAIGMALVTCSCLVGVVAGRAQTSLSAAEIVNRNVEARGGLQKWQAVQTLSMSGKMEAGGNSRPTLPMPGRKDRNAMPPARPSEQIRLPFLMELKRPRRSRVEVSFNGQDAIQVSDGASGWKLRPYLNRQQVEPYTDDEMKSVAAQAELDGPLVGYAAKGTTVALEGMEKVDGRDNYRLRLLLKGGTAMHIWVDAKTYLESKMEGTPRRLDGRLHPVEIYMRDYRLVQGLQIPFLLETKVLNAQAVARAPQVSEQILLDKVEVNPSLNDALFTRADLEAAATAKALVASTH